LLDRTDSSWCVVQRDNRKLQIRLTVADVIYGPRKRVDLFL
jgi:hypothetical protein